MAITSSSSSDSISETNSECISPRTVIPSPKTKEVKSPENVDKIVVSTERSENPAENVSEEEKLEGERDTAKDQEASLSSDDDQYSKVLAHLKPPRSVHVMESHHQQTTNSESNIVKPIMVEAWQLLNDSVGMFNSISSDDQETKMMKLRNREIEKPIRDTTTTSTNRKRIKRCETRTTNPPCGGGGGDTDNKEEEKEKEKEGRWSELPYDILDMIVKSIYVIDLINLRAVCKSWHYYSLSEFQPLKITKVPWLMTFSHHDNDANSSCKLIDPIYKRTYIVNDTKIKEKFLYYMDVQESKCGWVLMSSAGRTSASTFFLLYTPFSTQNNLIELPVLNSKFCIATFSSAPSSFGTGGTTTQQDDDDDCVVLAYNNSASGEVSISTWRRGDHTWRTRHLESYFPLLKVRSVVYSQGVFYCPSHTGSIGTFNVDRDEWVVLEPNTVSDEFKRDVVRSIYATIHLLQSDGEFLLVNLWVSKEVWERPYITIYRLDRAKMIWEWLELRSMGVRSLFIMKGTSLAIQLPKWMKHPKWKRIGFVCRDSWVCRDGKVMYFKVPIRPQGPDPCYPCTNLYGSYDGQHQIWIEPPPPL